MKLLFFISALCLSSVTCEIFDRPCRTDVPAKENFATLFYIGNWFELFFNSHTGDAECITHHYTTRGINDFTVETTFNADGEFSRVFAEVGFAFPDETPLRAIFNGTVETDDRTIDYVYQIYATDYTNYSIVWVCRDIEDDQSVENVAVYSRSATISNSTLTKVDSLLAQIGFDRNTFREVRHDEESCLIGEIEE